MRSHLLTAGVALGAGAMAGAVAILALPHPSLAQSAPAAAPGAGELFRASLPDMPGKQLVVVNLRFLPANGPKAPPHQHPGSVFVYVTKGEARLGVEGQAPQVVPTGKGFFEPVGAIHNVSESASATEAAAGIAVMIVPDGAPLLTRVPDAHAGH